MSIKPEKKNEDMVTEKKEFVVSEETAYILKLNEYDKKIAEAEEAVCLIKKDKAAFIFDSAVRKVIDAAK